MACFSKYGSKLSILHFASSNTHGFNIEQLLKLPSSNHECIWKKFKEPQPLRYSCCAGFEIKYKAVALTQGGKYILLREEISIKKSVVMFYS